MTFLERLGAARRRNASLLCVGLDAVPAAMLAGAADAAEAVLAFNRTLIEATSDLVCAYKPNLAFYEALGARGWWALKETVRAVPHDLPVIADAKRGDIGSSAERYAAAVFDELGCAACTVSPYMGYDSVAPFTTGERFAFVLCRTSNPGAGEFQDLQVLADGETVPLYEAVARRVACWTPRGHYGLVAGATTPSALARIGTAAPELTLLIPGVGTQGGDAGSVLAALGPGAASRVVVTISREIAQAARQGTAAGEAMRAVAGEWRDRLNAASSAMVTRGH